MTRNHRDRPGRDFGEPRVSDHYRRCSHQVIPVFLVGGRDLHLGSSRDPRGRVDGRDRLENQLGRVTDLGCGLAGGQGDVWVEEEPNVDFGCVAGVGVVQGQTADL